MVMRKGFCVEYDAWDGMTGEAVSQAREKARGEMVSQINAWMDSVGPVAIISIQEKSSQSHNSDSSPFWVAAVVYYQNTKGV